MSNCCRFQSLTKCDWQVNLTLAFLCGPKYHTADFPLLFLQRYSRMPMRMWWHREGYSLPPAPFQTVSSGTSPGQSHHLWLIKATKIHHVSYTATTCTTPGVKPTQTGFFIRPLSAWLRVQDQSLPFTTRTQEWWLVPMLCSQNGGQRTPTIMVWHFALQPTVVKLQKFQKWASLRSRNSPPGSRNAPLVITCGCLESPFQKYLGIWTGCVGWIPKYWDRKKKKRHCIRSEVPFVWYTIREIVWKHKPSHTNPNLTTIGWYPPYRNGMIALGLPHASLLISSILFSCCISPKKDSNLFLDHQPWSTSLSHHVFDCQKLWPTKKMVQPWQIPSVRVSIPIFDGWILHFGEFINPSAASSTWSPQSLTPAA